MAIKIGDIIKHNGVWCQLVEDTKINDVTYNVRGILKALERVKEPYISGDKLIQRYKIYPTTRCINVYNWYYLNLDIKYWTIDIELI